MVCIGQRFSVRMRAARVLAASGTVALVLCTGSEIAPAHAGPPPGPAPAPQTPAVVEADFALPQVVGIAGDPSNVPTGLFVCRHSSVSCGALSRVAMWGRRCPRQTVDFVSRAGAAASTASKRRRASLRGSWRATRVSGTTPPVSWTGRGRPSAATTTGSRPSMPMASGCAGQSAGAVDPSSSGALTRRQDAVCRRRWRGAGRSGCPDGLDPVAAPRGRLAVEHILLR